jgi:hypothetical protein
MKEIAPFVLTALVFNVLRVVLAPKVTAPV